MPPTSTQLDALRKVLVAVAGGNRFYQRKFADAGIDPLAIQDEAGFRSLPFTTKLELSADQTSHSPYGSNLTYTLDRYPRLHQTSGTTTGRSLRWLDTSESWNWLIGCWKTTFALMGLTKSDRVFFPFSFGPFLGFWTAFDAASQFGMLTMPGGGMQTTARLRAILEHEATVICCTPTYAVHMTNVADAEKINIARSAVRAVVVAGEPGGNIPATRERIANAWGARVFDHYGMTEVGPVAVECAVNPGGLHVLADDFIAEVLDPGTSNPTLSGQPGELVLTNLGRLGSPLIRYRTGDVVVLDTTPCPCGRSWPRLVGGVRGRTDDMIHVRGNNLYPSAIEAVIRRFPSVVEYRILVDRSGPLADLRLEIEPAANADGVVLAFAVAKAVRDELLFRVDVTAVACGSLPRFEMKARRVVNV